jgi:hypothetical protein
MQIIYKADDGTEFVTELECRNYEESSKIEQTIRLYKDFIGLSNAITHIYNMDFSQLDIGGFIVVNFEQINKLVTEARHVQRTDWSAVPKGTMIHVKNHEKAQFVVREFIEIDFYTKDYVCKNMDYNGEQLSSWKFAELIK